MKVRFTYWLENVEKLLSWRLWLSVIVFFLPALFTKQWVTVVHDYLLVPIKVTPPSAWVINLVIVIGSLLLILDILKKYAQHTLLTEKTYFFANLLPVWIIWPYLLNAWTVPVEASIASNGLLLWCILYLVGNTVLFLSGWFRSYSMDIAKMSRNNKNGFHFDTAQTDSSNDEYERTEYAVNIADKLLETKNDKQSFAVGIRGKWGSGKTTLLNFIEQAVKARIKEKKAESEILILKFNPWQFASTANLIEDFFSTFKNLLKPFNAELSSKVSQYLDSLLSIESNTATRISKLGLSALSKEKSLDELFKDLSDTIASLDKQMFVFIDDLDRLDKAEIIEVIRLIRNTANFPNTVFIVAYDRDYVTEAIKGLNDHDTTKYLEKIFQLEIDLPKSDVPVARNVLEKKLKNLCFEDNEKKELDQIFNPDSISLDSITLDTILEGHYSGKMIDPLSLLLSVRDVNRLVNSFSLSYISLKGEVVIKDLLYLEILRMKFPQVFLMLYERKDEWLTNEVRNKTGEIIEVSYRPSFYLKSTQSSEGTDLRETHIAQIDIDDSAQVPNLSTRERQEAVQLIATIFDGYKKLPLSIGHASHFEKYFAFRLTKNVISEVEFSQARASSDPEIFNDYIDKWVDEGKKDEVLLRFKGLITMSSFDPGCSDYELMISGLVYLIDKHLDASYYHELTRLLTIDGISSSKYDSPSDFQNFVCSTLKAIRYPSMLGMNVLHVLMSKDKVKEILTIEQQIQLLNEYWQELKTQVEEFNQYFQSFVIAIGRLKNERDVNTDSSTIGELGVILSEIGSILRGNDSILKSFFVYMQNNIMSNSTLGRSAAIIYEILFNKELAEILKQKPFAKKIDINTLERSFSSYMLTANGFDETNDLMNRVNPDNL